HCFSSAPPATTELSPLSLHDALPISRQRRLEQVGGVAGAGGAAGADQRVHFVDEQDDRLGAGLNLVDDRAQALLELALHAGAGRSEEHTSELQSRENLVCRLLLEKKK